MAFPPLAGDMVGIPPDKEVGGDGGSTFVFDPLLEAALELFIKPAVDEEVVEGIV